MEGSFPQPLGPKVHRQETLGHKEQEIQDRSRSRRRARQDSSYSRGSSAEFEPSWPRPEPRERSPSPLQTFSSSTYVDVHFPASFVYVDSCSNAVAAVAV